MRTRTLPSTSAVMRCALFDFENETTVGLHEQFKAHILIESNLYFSPQKIARNVHCFFIQSGSIGYFWWYLKPHRLGFAVEAVYHQHFFIRGHAHERVYIRSDVTLAYVIRGDVVILTRCKCRVRPCQAEKVRVEHA